MVKVDMERGERSKTNPLLAGVAFLGALLSPFEAGAQQTVARAPWMKDRIYDSRYDPEAPRWIRECLAVERKARELLRRRESPDFEEVFNCPDLPEVIDPLYDQILSPAERERRRHPQVP